ncbi:MAG TPA: hypothetical protein VH062_26755 [Polyangiaceae bacterium]|jgi:hypothetical protein|nr:hypothetical protein [Polyangiaceae bacterium]
MNNRYIPFLCCLIPSAAIAGCGADAQQSTAGFGGEPAGGSAAVTGAAGSISPTGAGGTAVTGAGGTTQPVGGGGTAVIGAGGTVISGGGVPTGAGGSVISGAGGTIGGGTGGADPAGGVATAMGTEYTFTTGHFTVPPGAEVYKCQDFTNPFGKDIGIVQEVTSLTPGSHHMFAFILPNGQLTLKDSLVDCPGGGVEFHDYLTTSGTPIATVTYPDKTGRIFSQANGLRLNVHLINSGTDPKDAFVVYKVVYVDPVGLVNKVASLFLNQVLLSVPPGMSTQSRSYSLPQDINLMGTASHMHKRGVHFVATASTGQTLYDGTEWQEPMPKSFDPPLPLKAGTKITWACTYNNDTGQTLSFGESAANNEMCIFPGEFYNSTGTQIAYQAIF